MTLTKDDFNKPAKRENRRNRRRRRGLPRLSDMFRRDYLGGNQATPKTATQKAFEL